MVDNEVDASSLNAKIYPNPFNSKLNIDLSSYQKIESVKIIDLKGTVLWEVPVSDLTNGTITIDQNFLSGMYMVEVKADQKVERVKVVKTN